MLCSSWLCFRKKIPAYWEKYNICMRQKFMYKRFEAVLLSRILRFLSSTFPTTWQGLFAGSGSWKNWTRTCACVQCYAANGYVSKRPWKWKKYMRALFEEEEKNAFNRQKSRFCTGFQSMLLSRFLQQLSSTSPIYQLTGAVKHFIRRQRTRSLDLWRHLSRKKTPKHSRAVIYKYI